ncbi:Chondroitin sulfate synthase 3 [Gracilariopsis chorda]|uniref:Chondroitin sulfate synthase 3 n=1 Tax=Gracilariopsis chorda TaxID=448386 RepID=A0A2V3ITS8_9FLOR|nr:Chondroitin sulfate synthase 3 [Gracilariopsis chorda]|eukprot:PXF45525.1 Chondroitin sulfate synthase 3 [Gracilariopsis chorda]
MHIYIPLEASSHPARRALRRWRNRAYFQFCLPLHALLAIAVLLAMFKLIFRINSASGEASNPLRVCMKLSASPLTVFDPYVLEQKQLGRAENDFENRFQEDVWDTLISRALYPAWSDMKWNIPQYARELAPDLDLVQAMAAQSIHLDGKSDVTYESSASLVRINYVHHRLDRMRGLQYVANFSPRFETRNESYLLVIEKGFDSSCLKMVSPPQRTAVVYVILPYKAREDRLRTFLENFLYLRTEHHENIVLIVSVLATRDEDKQTVAALKEEIFASYPGEAHHVVLHENNGDEDHEFSRGVALREATNMVPKGSDVIFHCDVDMIILPSFFERCRHNTIQGSQVYYPVFYSLYPYANANPTISERNGFWRKTSFGMTCMRRSDFKDVGAYDDAETRFRGWGSEDVFQYELVRNSSNLIAFRAVEPGLLHRWHTKNCDASSKGYIDCMKTNFVTMGHPLKIGPTLLKALPNAKDFFDELEKVGSYTRNL